MEMERMGSMCLEEGQWVGWGENWEREGMDGCLEYLSEIHTCRKYAPSIVGHTVGRGLAQRPEVAIFESAVRFTCT